MSDMLGPDISYAEILDHFTVEEEKKKAKEKPKYNPLRPSGIGRCARALAYEYARFKGLEGFDIEGEVKEANVVRLLGLGHTIEDKLFRDYDWKIDDKVLKRRYTQQLLRFQQFKDGTWLEGSIDGTFILKDHRALVDVKTKKDKFSKVNKSYWDELPYKLDKINGARKINDQLVYVDDLETFLAEFRLRDFFMSMNLYQLNLYYHDKGNFIRETGIDHCALVYYNKNDSRLFELRFRPSQKVADDRLQVIKDIETAVLDEKDPSLVKREGDLGSQVCAFCPWAKRCWEDADSLKAYFETFPKRKWPTKLKELDEEAQDLFNQYVIVQKQAESKDLIEKRLAKKLADEGLKKIELPSGDIYDVKFLKTQGHVLRRGKK